MNEPQGALEEDEVISADSSGLLKLDCTEWLPKPAAAANISTIFAADVSKVLRVLDDDSVDLVLTSPPYAERRKNAYGGIPADEYVEWFLPISAELLRVLRPTGSFVLNIKEGTQDGERQTYVYELALALRKQGWMFIDEMIWHKTNPFPTGSKKRLKDGFERCYQFSKTKGFKFFPTRCARNPPASGRETTRGGRIRALTARRTAPA